MIGIIVPVAAVIAWALFGSRFLCAASAIIALASAILAFLGFTSAGVAGGSIAAFVHSTIGNVTAGSLFAILQSLGAAGYFVIAPVVTFFAMIINLLGYPD